METAQWPQTTCEKGGGGAANQSKAARPPKEQGLNCPRCNSTNTKFCYYNNYSLSQPRYFCKTCRRYWTAGGSLRNIPVGGGSRKNKLRPSSHNYNSSSADDDDDDDNNNNNNNNNNMSSSNNKRVKLMSANPDLAIDGQDLDLGFMMVPPGYVGPTQDPAPGFSGGLSFSLDGFGLGAGGSTFAFQDLRQLGPGAGGIDGHDRDREGGSGDGFWSGVLGGGGAW